MKKITVSHIFGAAFGFGPAGVTLSAGLAVAAMAVHAHGSTPSGAATDKSSYRRPNIIYIITDQQWAGAMSCAGNTDLYTPNMDRLAENGVLFTNAYCSFPLSGPSRAAMFTGYMPCESGINENGMPLPDSLAANNLGTIMSEIGYDCIYAGKWHVNTISLPGDEAFGFRNIKNSGDMGLAEACVDWLQSRQGGTLGSDGASSGRVSGRGSGGNEQTDRPFFLVASFTNPHNICEFARGQKTPHADLAPAALEGCPNLPSNFAVSPYDAAILQYEKSQSFNLYPTTAYTPDDWRQYRNAYYRLIEAVDAEIGKIIDEIDRQGLWYNTVVIFTSDHGDGNGAHQWNQKTALYEEVANVPLIVCLPGKSNAGAVSEALVSNGIDLMPSVCDWGGAQVPPGRNGRSFRSAAENPVTYPDFASDVIAAGSSALGSAHDFVSRSITDSTASSTAGSAADASEEDCIVIETNFNQTSGTLGWMVRTPHYKYVLYDKGGHREQLFNMDEDRGEMRNLAVESKYSDVLQHHRALLRAWLEARFPFDASVFRYLPAD